MIPLLALFALLVGAVVCALAIHGAYAGFALGLLLPATVVVAGFIAARLILKPGMRADHNDHPPS